MALLDALALVRALNSYPIPAALKAYSHARRRHVNIYQMMSWAFTPMYQSSSRILPFLRDTILAPLSAVPPVPFILTKLVTGQFTNPLRGLAKKKSGE
jgi:2-polyprenyl-6-methoxyphenol hydroxylase-like FAD-dependent oxidoreductase